MSSGRVVAVSAARAHRFSKTPQLQIRLVAGLGVEGDVHAGATVQDSYNMRRTPDAPNLRQVHLIASERFAELAGLGFDISAGDIGENITTSGLDLHGLPEHTQLMIGEAVVELTGLRTPCSQLDKFASGLLNAMIDRPADAPPVLKCGVMGIVVQGGAVTPQDLITVVLPPEPWRPLPRL